MRQGLGAGNHNILGILLTILVYMAQAAKRPYKAADHAAPRRKHARPSHSGEKAKRWWVFSPILAEPRR